MKRNYFIEYVRKKDLYSLKKLPFLLNYLDFIFKDVSLEDKRILDIGGGSGLMSIYAIFNGCKSTVCVEPGSAGSEESKLSKLDKVQKNFHNLEVERIKFQNFEPETKFDVILLHNSINHLNEDAYVNLKNNRNAEKYGEIFHKIRNITEPQSNLIISDCARNNLFNKIKLKNPFIRNIQWNKHQSPETIVNLMNKQGFTKRSLDWLTPLTYFGFLNDFKYNKQLSYCISSYFRLIMKN